MKVETSAGGIVPFVRGGKVVVPMVTTLGGRISFPKGHIEGGETPELAAVREMEEEVGLKSVKVTAALGILTREKTDDAGNVKRKDVHIFLMQAEDLVYDHEDDFVWIPLSEATDLMQRPEESALLREHEARIIGSATPAFRSMVQADAWDGVRSSGGTEAQGESRLDARDGDVILCLGVGDSRRVVDLLSERQAAVTVVDVSAKALDVLETSASAVACRGALRVLHKDAHDVLAGDIPEGIDICFVLGALNLSDTKTIYLLNEIVRKMRLGGILHLEGLSADGVAGLEPTRVVGKNLVELHDGRLVRQWSEEFLRAAIAERLKLSVESVAAHAGQLTFVLKKVEDYAY